MYLNPAPSESSIVSSVWSLSAHTENQNNMKSFNYKESSTLYIPVELDPYDTMVLMQL